MHIWMIGLGKMGGNMALRLAERGITVEGIDPQAASLSLVAPGLRLHASIHAAHQAQAHPDAIWMMLPHGAPTEAALEELLALHGQGALGPQPLIVDGANAQFEDTQHRAQRLHEAGIAFMDCGVSGGVWGLRNGYCLMFGGAPEAMARVTPLACALAPSPAQGWLHCGPVGAGHYTKMIHNGIEYAMMQAMAEGFAMLQAKPLVHAPVGDIAELWRHGSVVRSWLLDLTAQALQDPTMMEGIAPVVPDSGEGRWALQEAVALGIPAPTLAVALMSRFDSQGKADAANKILALMRRGFGGHAVVPAASDKS